MVSVLGLGTYGEGLGLTVWGDGLGLAAWLGSG